MWGGGLRPEGATAVRRPSPSLCRACEGLVLDGRGKSIHDCKKLDGGCSRGTRFKIPARTRTPNTGLAKILRRQLGRGQLSLLLLRTAAAGARTAPHADYRNKSTTSFTDLPRGGYQSGGSPRDPKPSSAHTVGIKPRLPSNSTSHQRTVTGTFSKEVLHDPMVTMEVAIRKARWCSPEVHIS